MCKGLRRMATAYAGNRRVQSHISRSEAQDKAQSVRALALELMGISSITGLGVHAGPASGPAEHISYNWRRQPGAGHTSTEPRLQQGQTGAARAEHGLVCGRMGVDQQAAIWHI